MSVGKHFGNILAVVNWRDDGDGCFLAAIRIANKFGSNLHLICLRKLDETENSKDRNHCDNTENWKLRSTYRHLLEEQLSLYIHIVEEFSRNILLGYIARNRINLAIVWKRCGWFFPTLGAWIYANWLSKKAVCPVLSLQRHRDLQNVKNIILPVEHSLSSGKLMLALRMAGAYKARIHLVSIADRGEDNFFLRACQLLQYHRNIDVECKMLEGVSRPITIANYAIKVNVDLVLVCASKKTLANGVVGLLFSGRRSVSVISFMIIPEDELNIQ